jgi:hypothetical protein
LGGRNHFPYCAPTRCETEIQKPVDLGIAPAALGKKHELFVLHPEAGEGGCVEDSSVIKKASTTINFKCIDKLEKA